MAQNAKEKAVTPVASITGPKTPEISAAAESGALRAKDGVQSDKTNAQGDITNMLLTYDEVATRLKLQKRTVQRLVSKGVIRKISHMRQARFYWPDVLEDLRQRKSR